MKRASGVLLHVTSLPSAGGIGDFGPAAYRFIDCLSQAGQSCWQILPLNETSAIGGNSPYHTCSAYSGNTMLISLELLVINGWLASQEIGSFHVGVKNQVDYDNVRRYKGQLFELAFDRWHLKPPEPDYNDFCRRNASWLDDFTLFKALKAQFNEEPWPVWPLKLCQRQPAALAASSATLARPIEKEKFLQYIFYKQWSALKAYANHKGVEIFGDMAIYVELDSVDVWKNPEIFKLDKNYQPLFVSGVPPDYFSQTGQLWGHPVYNWEKLAESNFSWWLERLAHNFKLYDALRFDHFRGFVGYWQVAAGEKTAVNGSWVKAPAAEFFDIVKNSFPQAVIIAEDLGIITPDVKEVMNHFHIPGMKVLLFAFGENNPQHPYLPRNYETDCVVYTGTHDTNTARGWFEKEATADDKRRLCDYIGKNITAEEVSFAFIRLALGSPADLAIIPMQDVLELGEEGRMNRPSWTYGNWGWRLTPEQLAPEIFRSLANETKNYNRFKFSALPGSCHTALNLL
ncbi:4-alpha-glucanotransferase [Candidatus Saganbacteria bacterium]|nr:4-alpha-glucanotransferase [Candidatus Saganbacteria bacterium]